MSANEPSMPQTPVETSMYDLAEVTGISRTDLTRITAQLRRGRIRRVRRGTGHGHPTVWMRTDEAAPVNPYADGEA